MTEHATTCGISHPFGQLFPTSGQVTHALLSRPPLAPRASPRRPFDLHVSCTPPAFILSQDQTLRQKRTSLSASSLSSGFARSHLLISYHSSLVKVRAPATGDGPDAAVNCRTTAQRLSSRVYGISAAPTEPGPPHGDRGRVDYPRCAKTASAPGRGCERPATLSPISGGSRRTCSSRSGGRAHRPTPLPGGRRILAQPYLS
jgi:hypothetical protein